MAMLVGSLDQANKMITLEEPNSCYGEDAPLEMLKQYMRKEDRISPFYNV